MKAVRVTRIKTTEFTDAHALASVWLDDEFTNELISSVLITEDSEEAPWGCDPVEAIMFSERN